jgi:hypothetical protein
MLNGTGGDYQLVMNPDVELAPDALANAIRWLDANPDVVAVAPAITRPDGTPDFLCKRYPAVLDLFLRGFSAALRPPLVRAALDRYDLRTSSIPRVAEPVRGMPVMSGCCMLVRGRRSTPPAASIRILPVLRGLRLERAAEQDRSDGLPARVSRRASRRRRRPQGLRHVGWFVRSALRFYRKHGWRFV